MRQKMGTRKKEVRSMFRCKRRLKSKRGAFSPSLVVQVSIRPNRSWCYADQPRLLVTLQSRLPCGLSSLDPRVAWPLVQGLTI